MYPIFISHCDRDTLEGVKRYVFKSPIASAIRQCSDYRSPAVQLAEPYVNDRFKQLVEDNNLTSLEFTKVWEE